MRFLLFLILLLINFCSPILASDNNFGLHLTQTSDIHSAKNIINSSGGDWGWATIVIRPDQLNHSNWQDFFDNCRNYHIIPIIRLASNMKDGYWTRPTQEEIDKMATFLNSLNWPNKKQHIILYNEINHGQEWGGAVDVKSYVDSSIYASKKFKSLNQNFYILSNGLDLAAPSKNTEFESAENVYKQIVEYNKEYFDLIDAIASHSYPNHGFVGKPYDTGKTSIKGYQWELDYIKSLGITKQFPIYITETGWPHREGSKKNNQYYTSDTSAEFLKEAYKIWGQDKNVKAVTPFIYNYPYAPFDHFSWLDKNEKLLPKYQEICDMPKCKNSPEQITKYEQTKMNLPLIIFTDTEYKGSIVIKNTGQSILGENGEFCINPQSTTNISISKICIDTNKKIKPNETYVFHFNFKIDKNSDYKGKSYISWDNLPGYEITHFNNFGNIYRPKTGIKDHLLSFVKKLVKYKYMSS